MEKGQLQIRPHSYGKLFGFCGTPRKILPQKLPLYIPIIHPIHMKMKAPQNKQKKNLKLAFFGNKLCFLLV
jgi:hypothetical protein